ILARLQEETTGHRCLIWHDPEPEITWEPDRRYPMWHCETFHAHHNAGEVRRFFLNTALPYLRQRGFYLKFFYNLSHLGPSRFWFITGMENFSMLDRWETMASGEPEGAQIMGRLLELIDLPRAAVLREIT
ncbi:MAG TPA: hypothetical protein PLY40_01410, partial [Bacillota bacterium]|nr:hypothetical protein [Bacillota bacterium]